MNRLRKALFLLFFSVLLIDISSFTMFYMYPQVFTELLTKYLGPEALGLVIVGGFITAIGASTALLLITYGEIRTIVTRSLRVKMIHPPMKKVGITGRIKEIIEKSLRKGLER